MAIFSSNRDLDSTITTIGIHILMGGAMYFYYTTDSSTVSSLMTELLIAYTGICSYLFGKAKGQDGTTEGKKL